MRTKVATWVWLVPLVFVGSSGCASYRGSARDVTQPEVAADARWTRVEGVPLVRQQGVKDCGAAALSMVLGYWEPDARRWGDAGARRGEGVSPNARAEIDQALRREAGSGLSAGDLRDYARERGYSAFVFEGKLDDLQHELALGHPVIVGVHKPLTSGEMLAHYEVFIGLHSDGERVLTLDPAHGLRENAVKGFLAEWASGGNVTLVIFPKSEAAAALR
jgi:predicted double-glycine peptidase